MKFLCNWNIHKFKLQHVKVTYQFRDGSYSELIEPSKTCSRCGHLVIKNPMGRSGKPWLDVKTFKREYKAIIEEL